MKPRLVFPVIALICIGAAGCGRASNGAQSSSRVTSSPATSSGAATATPDYARGQRYLNDGDAEKVNDQDMDNRNSNHEDGDADSSEEYETTYDNGDYHDSDDGKILSFGHAASPSETRTAAALVKRYYAAAATDNSAQACSMMTPAFANSLAESYGQSDSPAYLRGRTCQAIISGLFEHFHKRLSGAVAVTAVRVNGTRGLAFTGSSTMSAGYTFLEREHGAWKIVSLMGSALP